MLTGRAALALMLLALGAPLAAMGRRLASHPLATRLAPVARASGSTMRMSDIAAPSWPRDAQMVPQGLPGGGVSLTGTLTKVLYARPGYYVYILHTAQGRTPDVTLVSRTDIASSGHIRVEGRWGFHYKYGERFDVWSAFVEANGAAGQPLEPTAMAAVYPAHPAHSTQYTQPQFAQPPYPAQPAHSTQYTPPQFAQPTYAQPHTLPKYTYSQHAPQHQYARPHTKQQYTYPQQAQPQFAQPQFTQPQYSAYPVVHPASEHVVVHPASEHVGWAPAASPLPAWQQPTAPPARAAYSYAPPGNAAAALYARPSYPRPAAALETIVGTLSSITFRSDDGFTIARLILEKAKSFGESSGPAGLELNRKREKGVRSKSVVVRSAEALAFTRVGDTLTLTGAWSTHAKFGRQFDAATMAKPKLPTSTEEAIAFLASGAIKGIGPGIAAKISKSLGDDVVRLVHNDPEIVKRLNHVSGVGPSTFARISASLAEHAGKHELVNFCTKIGLGMGAALRLSKIFKGEAEAKILENPYLLVEELPDISFQRADAVAAKLDFKLESSCRLRAALLQALRNAASGFGHCYLSASALLLAAERTLAVPAERFWPERAALAAALAELVESRNLNVELMSANTTASVSVASLRALNFGPIFPISQRASGALAADPNSLAALRSRNVSGASEEEPEAVISADDVAVYLPWAYEDELKLARAIRARLTELQRGSGHLKLGGTEALSPAAFLKEDPSLSELSPQQLMAVELAISGRRLVVLTGGPGTGKTRTVEHIVRLWRQAGKRVQLACPTARGAAVLTEVTGVQAKTVHRLLEFKPTDEKFARSSENTIDADAIVVDEASMLDAALAASLLDALPLKCTLLLVGDPDQLPSVGPGQVLRDVLSCPAVERIRLNQIFRTEGAGEIAHNAELVNKGLMMQRLQYLLPDERPEEAKGCKLILAASAGEAADAIGGSVLQWIEEAGYDLATDLQVLTPTKMGEAGVIALNKQLQARLNPNAVQHARRLPAGANLPPIFVGDRVIQLRNDYDKGIFNGDVGSVIESSEQTRKFKVAFRNVEAAEKDTSNLEYTFGDLDKEISLAYALTVHKAQGSEYPVVVMPALHEHATMLSRNLLYTAISRAKKLLVIVGSPRAIEAGIADDKRLHRLTRLTHLISTDTYAVREIDVDELVAAAE